MDITISIPDSTIANVIFSGLASGIGHWCSVAKITGRKKGVVSGILGPGFERYFRPFQDGSLVVVSDYETKKKHVIDRAAIVKALEIIGEKYPHHLRNILADNTDAETGDVLIQCAAFGDIVYD